MPFIVNIEIVGGTYNNDAKKEALVFAKRNQCSVRYKFDEDEIMVYPRGVILTNCKDPELWVNGKKVDKEGVE